MFDPKPPFTFSRIVSIVFAQLGFKKTKRFEIQKRRLASSRYLLYTKASLKGTPLHDYYSQIIPEIVIEVDTKADTLTIPTYYLDKTKHLHKNGVRRVIWIFTSPEQVMVAERGEKWTIQDWSESFEVTDGFMLNIKELIDDYEE